VTVPIRAPRPRITVALKLLRLLGRPRLLVNAQATLLVRFSATSSCDTAFGVACKIYVLLDGVPQSPVAGYVFDSSPGNNAPNPAKSLAMERVLGPLDAGTYTVQIQGSFPHGGDAGSASPRRNEPDSQAPPSRRASPDVRVSPVNSGCRRDSSASRATVSSTGRGAVLVPPAENPCT
jgi:hypothetical protein